MSTARRLCLHLIITMPTSIKPCDGKIKDELQETLRRNRLKAQRFDLVVLCHTLNIEHLINIAVLAHNQHADVKVLQVLRLSNADY
jgi:hypothetical protein